jgi:lipoprotein-releasing system permease protein
MAGWQSGYAAACKAADAGSIPTPACLRLSPGGEIGRRKGLKIPRNLNSVPVRLRPWATKKALYLFTQNLTILVTLRYLTQQKSKVLISFVSISSVLGIAFGVAILITVLSVMNGFQEDIKKLFLNNTPHIEILPNTHDLMFNANVFIKEDLKNKIDYMYPIIQSEAMILKTSKAIPVMLIGIETSQLSHLISSINLGKDPFKNNKVLISESLKLELDDNFIYQNKLDEIQVIVPRIHSTLLGIIPKFKVYSVSGVVSNFSLNAYKVLIMNLVSAQKLLNFHDKLSSFRIFLKNPYEADNIAKKLSSKYSPSFRFVSWQNKHATYFRAVQTEKTMMALILSLIVLISSFNLLVSLTMMVHEKKSDIAILRTCGLNKLTLVRVFVLIGGILGFIATTLGIVMGIALEANITTIAKFLEGFLGTSLIPPSIYGLDYLPSLLDWTEVLWISSSCFLLTCIAGIYPALKAAKINPSKILCHE